MPAPPDIPWYHSYDLGDHKIVGAQSLEYLAYREEVIFGGVDVRDKTVLDICTWSGYMAFAAERHGAREVTAIDDAVWRHMRGREGFDYLHKHFDSKVLADQVHMDNLGAWLDGKHFDIILCLGLLYHVRNPIHLIELCAKHSDTCVLDTLLGMLDCPHPAMQYLPKYEPTELANYFVPNASCVEHLMRDYGFKNVRITLDKNGPSQAVFHATK